MEASRDGNADVALALEAPGEVETDGVDEVRHVVAYERAREGSPRLVDRGRAGVDEGVRGPQGQGLAEDVLDAQRVPACWSTGKATVRRESDTAELS
jgi:hypothetical protein